MASPSSSSINHNHSDSHDDHDTAGGNPEQFFRKLRALQRAASVPAIPPVPADPDLPCREIPGTGTAQQQQQQQWGRRRPLPQGQKQPQPHHRRGRSEGSSSKSVRFRGWDDDDSHDEHEHDPSTSNQSPEPGLPELRGPSTSSSSPSSSSSASASTQEPREAVMEDLPRVQQLGTPPLLPPQPQPQLRHGRTPRILARISIFFMYQSVMFTLKWVCLPIIILTLVSVLLERLGILALRFFLPRLLWLCVRPLLTGLATSLGALLGIVVPAAHGNDAAGSQEPIAGVPPYHHHHYQLHDLFAAVVDGNGYGGLSSVYGALLLQLSQGVLDTNHLALTPADRARAQKGLDAIEHAAVQHHNLLNLTSHLASFVHDRLPGIAWPLGVLMGDITADPAHDHAARCWTGNGAWEVHLQRLERVEAGRSDMSSLIGDVAAIADEHDRAARSQHATEFPSSGKGRPDMTRKDVLQKLSDELRSSYNKRRMAMSKLVGESAGAGAGADDHPHPHHGSRSRFKASWTDDLYWSQQRTETVINNLLKSRLGQGMGASTLGQTLKVWNEAMVSESAIIIDWWDAIVVLEQSIPANESMAHLRQKLQMGRKLQQDCDDGGGGSIIWGWSGLWRVWRLAGCRCQYTYPYSSDDSGSGSGSGSGSVCRWRIHVSQDRVTVATKYDRQMHEWARQMVYASERAVRK